MVEYCGRRAQLHDLMWSTHISMRCGTSITRSSPPPEPPIGYRLALYYRNFYIKIYIKCIDHWCMHGTWNNSKLRISRTCIDDVSRAIVACTSDYSSALLGLLGRLVRNPRMSLSRHISLAPPQSTIHYSPDIQHNLHTGNYTTLKSAPSHDGTVQCKNFI